MTDDQLHAFCLQWQHWKRTRRLLGAPPTTPPSILARLQPAKSGGTPDGPMSADLACFDLAVRAMPDTVDKFAFLTYYARHTERAEKPVKVVASDLGISRKTFYKAIKRARADLYKTAQRFKAANLSVARALAGEETPEAMKD